LSRILAIDYGLKRVGIAVTDPLKIIAQPLTTVDNKELIAFLKDYFNKESVELIVIGFPETNSDDITFMQTEVKALKNKLNQIFPTIPTAFEDESYTSQNAAKSMIEIGMKKSKRRDKRLLDTMSASLILQRFLEGRL
jgi:putative Holliday junction resolvase